MDTVQDRQTHPYKHTDRSRFGPHLYVVVSVTTDRAGHTDKEMFELHIITYSLKFITKRFHVCEYFHVETMCRAIIKTVIIIYFSVWGEGRLVAVHPSGPEGPPTIIEMKYVHCDNADREDLDQGTGNRGVVRKETTYYYYKLLLVEFIKRLRWIYYTLNYIRRVDYGEEGESVCESSVILFWIRSNVSGLYLNIQLTKVQQLLYSCQNWFCLPYYFIINYQPVHFPRDFLIYRLRYIPNYD